MRASAVRLRSSPLRLRRNAPIMRHGGLRPLCTPEGKDHAAIEGASRLEWPSPVLRELGRAKPSGLLGPSALQVAKQEYLQVHYAKEHMSQAAAASPPGTFQALIDVADNLATRAADHANTLHIQIDRIVGGLPPGSNEAQAPKPVPNGFIEQMEDRLHSLDASLSYLADQIERLSAR